MDYRYANFSRRLLAEDAAFRAGPAPGDPMPELDLPTTDGERVRKEDFVGLRPLLLTIGSITCPMTAAAAPILKKLHEQYEEQVAFLTLYVREAHPGDRYPQPAAFDQKAEHARAYKERDQIPWPVAVDDIEGTFHRAFDSKPNAAYFMRIDGTMVFRSLFSNVERPLRRALEIVSSGYGMGQDDSRLIPMLRGVGSMREVLAASGPAALRDLRQEAPAIYAAARTIGVFPARLGPIGRSVAALSLLAGAAGGAVFLSRRRGAA